MHVFDKFENKYHIVLTAEAVRLYNDYVDFVMSTTAFILLYQDGFFALKR